MTTKFPSQVAHPWHGLTPGDNCPEEVQAYIEMVPADTCKYETDKESGLLMLDRPQKFSNHLPCLYGFIPQTYCADEIAKYAMDKTGREGVIGDGDPIDICVFAERTVTHGNIIVQAKPIGGFRFFDGEEADDKIIAVLKDDMLYADANDISDISASVIDRLKHYFLTYKQRPGSEKVECEITDVYGREEALEIIRASQKDYATLIG
jgi:inorganic pyrophosphatase